MRSPSVERLIWSSSAARDLLPLLTFSAQVIRFDSSSRIRSSSAIGAAATSERGHRSERRLMHVQRDDLRAVPRRQRGGLLERLV